MLVSSGVLILGEGRLSDMNGVTLSVVLEVVIYRRPGKRQAFGLIGFNPHHAFQAW